METYTTKPSPLLVAKAKEDERIVHLHFKVPEGEGKDYPVAYLQNPAITGENYLSFRVDKLPACSLLGLRK